MTVLINCEWDDAVGGRCICASAADRARITAHRTKLLNLITDYHTNPDIAIELGIAEKTVKREIEDLRTITGCRSKRVLARWWLAHHAVWEAFPRRRPTRTEL